MKGQAGQAAQAQAGPMEPIREDNDEQRERQGLSHVAPTSRRLSRPASGPSRTHVQLHILIYRLCTYSSVTGTWNT